MLADSELSARDQLGRKIVHRNGMRLLKLVNALFDFSRIESGRAHANYQPIELAALTRDLVSNFRSASEKAGLRLTIDCSPPPSRSCDHDMWEKIVLNLVSNAFKFHTMAGSLFPSQIGCRVGWSPTPRRCVCRHHAKNVRSGARGKLAKQRHLPLADNAGACRRSWRR